MTRDMPARLAELEARLAQLEACVLMVGDRFALGGRTWRMVAVRPGPDGVKTLVAVAERKAAPRTISPSAY